MDVIISGWWEEEAKRESVITPDATTEQPQQLFSSSIIDDDVIDGSDVFETSQSTLIQTVFTSEEAETGVKAMADDGRFVQYGLIGLAFAILACFAILVFVKTRKRPRILDMDDDVMTSSVDGELGGKYYEIGENSARRNSKVNQAFHSTETSGQSGLLERAMTYSVLYRLEQQDPDYAVIDECTQPEQTSENPSNSDSAVYAVVIKSKNGHTPVINQSVSEQSSPNYMEFQSVSSSSSIGVDETKNN